MAFEFLATTLRQRETDSLRRVRYAVVSNKDGMILIDGKHYLNFASNDYLGLSQHEQVLQSYVEGLAVYGCGSGASSVVTGYSAEHQALEEDLCEALNKPAAMLFSSGFAANQAICHALFASKNAKHDDKSPIANSANNSANNSKNNIAKVTTPLSRAQASAGKRRVNPHIIADKYMHASFLQGALDTGAHLARFKHNDMSHAQALISIAGPNSLVATEGIFSMDGDQGDVAQLQHILQTNFTLKDKRPWLFVDDAHAFGVLGKSGFGSLDCESVDPHNVDVVMGTFGKALGTSGAFVAGSVALIEYMVNMSKHYVYSTAISAAQARATRSAFVLVEQGEQRNSLHSNINHFRQGAKQRGIVLNGSTSAIQVIIIGDPLRALKCSEHLAELGLWIPAIRTPTVPKNTDRLRITLSAVHSKQDINALLDALEIAVLPILDKINSSDGVF